MSTAALPSGSLVSASETKATSSRNPASPRVWIALAEFARGRHEFLQVRKALLGLVGAFGFERGLQSGVDESLLDQLLQVDFLADGPLPLAQRFRPIPWALLPRTPSGGLSARAATRSPSCFQSAASR